MTRSRRCASSDSTRAVSRCRRRQPATWPPRSRGLRRGSNDRCTCGRSTCAATPVRRRTRWGHPSRRRAARRTTRALRMTDRWTPPPRPEWVERLLRHGDAIGGAKHLIPLDADELVATAIASTGGLQDFGPPTWRPHYDVLLRSITTE